MNLINIEKFKHFPSNKHFQLTKDGLDRLKLRLDQLRKDRFSICKSIRKMDPKDRAEYMVANDTIKSLKINDREVSKINEILLHTDIISNEAKGGANIKLGSVFKLSFGRKTLNYTLVDTIEADPLRNKISNESPLGKALIGKKKDAIIKVINRRGKEYQYRILNVAK